MARRTDAFLHDTLLEVFLTAERHQWQKRAEVFEAARPRPGDFHGAADRQQLSDRWQRLTETAQACRARAEVSPVEDIRDDIRDVLSEVA